MDEKSIKKLNNSNYATWKLKIELLLIKDDLWSVVVDEPVNPVPVDFAKKDGQARAIIGLSVDDNQFVHLRGFTTAKAYWDRLKAVHTKSSFTAKVITLKNLCRKTLTEDGDMEDHLQEIFNLIDKLSSLGEELKPNLTIVLILCSLPDSYTSLINSLEARKEEDLTIDIVREKLLEEFHRRKDTKINNEVALKTNYRKNFSNSNKNCQQKGNESSQFVCKHCGKIRHLMKNCFFLKNKNKSQNNYHKANKAAFEDKEVCVRVNLKEDISNSWFIDSAASCHMTNNKQFFDCFSSSDDNIILADGSKVKALGRGDGYIKCLKGACEKQIKIRNVIYVPELHSSKLVREGFKIIFENNTCQVQRGDKVYAYGELINNLFKLIMYENANLTYRNEKKSLSIWHRRLGHRNTKSIERLSSENLATGIEILTSKDSLDDCEICLKGKQYRRPFSERTERNTSEILQIIHADLCGPVNIVTPSGNKYIFMITDDYSKYTEVYFLKNKCETFTKLQEYINYVKNKFGRYPKVFRSDGGGEFINNKLQTFLKSIGVIHQTSAPYTPQQNGVAERKNRTVIEMAKCMLLDSGIDKKYWAKAVNTAVYILNVLPSANQIKTPFELWYDIKSNLSHIRVFGSTAYVFIQDNQRRKFDDKSKKLVLVGFCKNTKAYRLLDPITNKITISRNVHFVEDLSKIESKNESVAENSDINCNQYY